MPILMADKICEIITPFVGAGMAEAALKTLCRRLGIEKQQLTAEHLPDCAAYIEKAFTVLLGRVSAHDVSSVILQLSPQRNEH